MTAEPAPPNAGDPAPGFTATAVCGEYGTGRPLGGGIFAVRPVVLYFYPKDDTPGGTAQACGLRDAWSESTGGAEILG